MRHEAGSCPWVVEAGGVLSLQLANSVRACVRTQPSLGPPPVLTPHRARTEREQHGGADVLGHAGHRQGYGRAAVLVLPAVWVLPELPEVGERPLPRQCRAVRPRES